MEMETYLLYKEDIMVKRKYKSLIGDVNLEEMRNEEKLSKEFFPKPKEAPIEPLLEAIENLSVNEDLEKILSIISKHSKLKTFCHFLRQDGGYINENSPYRNKRDYFKNMIIKLKGGKE